MAANYVVYKVYNPEGEHVKTFFNRKSAKAYIDLKNKDVPSWHYDELYKMACEVERR